MKHDFRPEDFEPPVSCLSEVLWCVVIGVMIVGAIWIGLS